MPPLIYIMAIRELKFLLKSKLVSNNSYRNIYETNYNDKLALKKEKDLKLIDKFMINL